MRPHVERLPSCYRTPRILAIGADGADMAERITWVTCPSCGGRTALGWIDQTATEVHCLRECELTEEQIFWLILLSDPPPAEARREP